MNKYNRWLNKALEQLSKDFFDERFLPKNESDVQCHLYHSFLSTKEGCKGLTNGHVVLSEFGVSDSRKKIDLAIAKKTKNKLEPRLVLEIKKTSSDHLPPNKIERRVQNDVVKLRRYKKGLGNKVSKAIGKPVIYFFFCGAGKNGIGTETNRKLEYLKPKYNDVILEWGPR